MAKGIKSSQEFEDRIDKQKFWNKVSRFLSIFK